MIKKIAKITLLTSLFIILLTQLSFSYQNDFAQDVDMTGNPSPVDRVTGSSVNQFSAGETNSRIDDYIYQNEQINLNKDAGVVKVLRTNQKSELNDFVTIIIPIKHAVVRELRGVARTICRKEGGDANILSG